eukprot:Amastigsp_a351388_19.p2 type:complete len:223 gc:universal Amastigsp_a351388_19:828-160(-)
MRGNVRLHHAQIDEAKHEKHDRHRRLGLRRAERDHGKHHRELSQHDCHLEPVVLLGEAPAEKGVLAEELETRGCAAVLELRAGAREHCPHRGRHAEPVEESEQQRHVEEPPVLRGVAEPAGRGGHEEPPVAALHARKVTHRDRGHGQVEHRRHLNVRAPEGAEQRAPRKRDAEELGVARGAQRKRGSNDDAEGHEDDGGEGDCKHKLEHKRIAHNVRALGTR